MVILTSNCTKIVWSSKWEEQYGVIYYDNDGAEAFCIGSPSAVPLEADSVSRMII